jgi:hypothetical protein
MRNIATVIGRVVKTGVRYPAIPGTIVSDTVLNTVCGTGIRIFFHDSGFVEFLHVL